MSLKCPFKEKVKCQFKIYVRKNRVPYGEGGGECTYLQPILFFEAELQVLQKSVSFLALKNIICRS